MTAGKALGVKIFIANTIALFLIAVITATTEIPEYSVTTPASIAGVPAFNPGSISASWKAPTTGNYILDWILVFYFTSTYLLAIWLILNPLA